MSQKTVLLVELFCSRCRQKVMKIIASVEGITSIVLDPAKNRVTVVGEADPVKIIKKVRKFQKSAKFDSVGSASAPKEEKKEEKKVSVPDTPYLCNRCDVRYHWYVTVEDGYSNCSIL